MEISFSLHSVWIPIALTVIGFITALSLEKDSGTYGAGLDTMFYLMVAGACTTLVWVVYAVCLLWR